MSSTIDTIPEQKFTKERLPWALWLRQIRAIFRLEIRKNFLGKRSILIYLLALLPIFMLGSLVLVTTPTRNFANLGRIFAWIYGGLILRTVVFFGCAWIFMNLFRGELVDRSLHYYFLSPVRREVLVVGKYFSGLVTSAILFTMTTVVSMLLLYFPHFPAESGRFFFEGPGYLNSLVPVPAPEATPFAVIAEPTPAWLAIPGLLVVTLLVLIAASYRIRRLEIKYGGD